MAAKKKARASAGAKRATASGKRSSSTRRAASQPARAPVASRTVKKAKKVTKKVTRGAKRPASPPRQGAAREAESTATGALQVGDPAPRFQLLDHAGNTVSSDELSGKPYVLYFYPKDDTPGCTTEACGFRDALPAFERLGVRVLGVSPDSPASHERFRGKYSLPFTLLSDADKSLATAYGAWALKKNYGREYMGVVRSTFLVGADGVVHNAWRSVKVNGHVDQVQAAAAELS